MGGAAIETATGIVGETIGHAGGASAAPAALALPGERPLSWPVDAATLEALT
jgi:hypothetical protein